MDKIDTLTKGFPYLQQMGLLMDIEMVLAGQESLIAIKGGIERGRPAAEIIKTCQHNIRDNEPVMRDILGNALVDRIKRQD